MIGIGSLVLGFVLMLIQWAVEGSWFRHPDVPVSAATEAEVAALEVRSGQEA